MKKDSLTHVPTAEKFNIKVCIVDGKTKLLIYDSLTELRITSTLFLENSKSKHLLLCYVVSNVFQSRLHTSLGSTESVRQNFTNNNISSL